LALISTAGLVTSFIYLMMSRVGYRAITLPPLLLLTGYFFWLGWHTHKLRYYLLAGLGLGLCQYTYLSARLLPLVYFLFLVVYSGLNRKRPALRERWTGLILMGIVSGLVFVPLLLFFLAHPAAFTDRASDVSLKLSWSWLGLQTFAFHLLEAVRVFIDGGDPNWRHHLLTRAGFDLFNTLGFWLGAGLALRAYRQSVYLFLLTSIMVMWLPGIFSQPAFHTLRLSGVLPAYYALMALGLLTLLEWLGRWKQATRLITRKAENQVSEQAQIGLVALGLVLGISGSLTFYDYFYRWASRPELSQAFETQVVELASLLTRPEAQLNLIIPFHLYTHASMRYLLHPHFEEQILMPAEVRLELEQQKEVPLLVPDYPRDDGRSPALVWLLRDEAGRGTAYVSEVRGDLSLSSLQETPAEILKGQARQELARQYQLKTRDILPLFPQALPQKQAAFQWAGTLALAGYEFTPPLIEAGNSSALYLAWQILGHVRIQDKLFVQFLDSQGQPAGQYEIESPAISIKLHRWREDRLLLEKYPLQFGTELKPDLYFVRLGFFNPKSNQRLPVYPLGGGESLGDEIILGPLYLGSKALMRPQYPVQGRLDEAFELLGYSILPAPSEDSVEIQLFWQSHKPVTVNYTAFVQALDSQNQVIAQHDAQPLEGIYPTSRWQPGDQLSDRFILPVSPQELSAGSYRLVTGMYDLATGVRLPVYDNAGESLPDGLIRLN
jgi:hypothetical protein